MASIKSNEQYSFRVLTYDDGSSVAQLMHNDGTIVYGTAVLGKTPGQAMANLGVELDAMLARRAARQARNMD